MIGTVLGGRYTIIEEVGKGGMAHVYKAKCNVLNRVVAVKMLRTDLEGGDEFVHRFNAEAQAAACLAHPNIVSIYDVGEENGLYYIVMEYIEGITLKEYIKSKGKLSSEESAEIASQICAALGVAHEKNIIHRDIKPHNIMITSNNLIKVTDFGIARASNNATMQVGDSILGSVHYISPEQARGGYVDCRSDIYSLGIVLYEMLTGKLPFESESPIAIAMKHLEEIPVPPKTLCPDVFEELEEIVLKSISKETRKRYQSVLAMKSDLDVVLNMIKNANGEQNVENDYNEIAPIITTNELVNIEPEDNNDSEDNFEVKYNAVHINDEMDEEDNNFESDNSDEVQLNDNLDDNTYNQDEIEDDLEDGEYDEYEERGGLSFGMILTAIIIALVVVGGATLVIGAFVFPDAPFYAVTRAMWDDNDVDVPTFVGKSLEEAKRLAKETGVEINVVESNFGPEADGIVTHQSVASGNSVKEGTIINIETSKGPDPEIFTTKYFEGESEDVIDNYEKKGYNIVRKFKTDDSKKRGTIIEVVLKKDKIIFYINSEDDSNKIKVPDLTGLTVNQARAELEEVGLLLLEEDEYATKESETVKEGRVVAQSKSAGDSVNAKTRIKIYLAVKPEEKKEDDEPKADEEVVSDNTKTEEKEEPKTAVTSNESTTKTTKKTITLDMSKFESNTNVKIVDPTGKAVYDRTVDPSTHPEINISLEGKGTVTYVVYVNGSEFCKYPVSFGK